jgi:hypothetical protein
MKTPAPPLSVIIPAFNRVGPLKFTLRSVARAAHFLGEPVETLLVDDGSSPPVAEQLRGFDPLTSVTHLRQENQGSIVARLYGLRAARGEFILFLDSDDLVHPEKFKLQLAALRGRDADVSYADMAVAVLGTGFEIASFGAAEVLRSTDEPAKFFIEVQPAPHNPIYRRTYLERAFTEPIVPAVRAMDPAGDVWFFYNLAALPAKIAKISGPLSAPGPHGEERYSRHWEKLGVAALQVMERFTSACPKTPQTVAARTAAGEAAFRTWRNLPRAFHAEFARRVLQVYRDSPRGPASNLGTRNFARLAGVLGPIPAGCLLRMIRSRPYSEVRTLAPEDYARLFAEFGNAK